MAILRRYLLIGLLLWIGSASALSIPAKPANYINDYAHLLSPSVAQNLNQQLRQFEKQTTNQIVVAIFPSLENESLEDFTTRLEDQWKIGQTGKDNGILMVIFVKEHQVRIEVGYGLEGVVPDALAGQIIQGSITPNFKAQHYDAGVSDAINILMKVTKNADLPAAPKKVASDHTVFYIVGIAFLIVNFIVFIYAYRRSAKVSILVPRKSTSSDDNDNPENPGQSTKGASILYFILMLVLSLIGRGGGGRNNDDDFKGGGGGRSGGGGANGQW